MSSANLGWLFYKDYFKNLDYTNLNSDSNSSIIQHKIDNLLNTNIQPQEPTMLGSSRFQATTTYPGLLLGSGYLHELPDVKSQAILGFYFDYTTGLPLISGSSIKGVLRSAFKHTDYIKYLLNDEKIDVKSLEIEIFGQNNGDSSTTPGKDIFFDAEIIKGSRILGDDYITPHNNPLKNPTPLHFIKVLPNVTFLFQFELQDGLISKEKKIKLFKEILADLGLGAKTNVGYGKFKDFKDIGKTKSEIEAEAKQKEEEKKKKLEKLSPVDRVFEEYNNDIPTIINNIKSGKIESSIHKELAQKIKTELMKTPKTWQNAKQKALKRKEYIESILNS